jgi:fructose-specific phosphotransferase system IIC component
MRTPRAVRILPVKTVGTILPVGTAVIILQEKAEMETPRETIRPEIILPVMVIPRGTIPPVMATHPVMVTRLATTHQVTTHREIRQRIHQAVEIGRPFPLHILQDQMVETTMAVVAEGAAVEISHLNLLNLLNPQSRTTRAGRDLGLDPGPEAIG